MKSEHPVITLLGSNSGNNLGDAAIMSSILEHFSNALPGAEFLVPTTKPSFTNEKYGARYNVKALDMMPWTASIRFVGVPTFWALSRSDVALICDGIIFGKKLWNPFFNWLIALVLVVPFARLVNCKVVCYSCGIGPFQTKISRIFAKWTLNLCDLVIMRENDSKKLAEEIGVTKPIEVTGDAAFINPVSDEARGDVVAKELGLDFSKPTLGVNVNQYFDQWLAKGETLQDRNSFLDTLAAGIKDAREKLGENFQVVCFATHPMDEGAVKELSAKLDNIWIGNRQYLSHDIQAIMRKCELFLGMRFHSVVLASAVEVPVIGMIYMPKVRGFMRQLDCEEYAVELNTVTKEKISEIIQKGWKERSIIKAKQKKVIDELKAGALNAVQLVKQKIFN